MDNISTNEEKKNNKKISLATMLANLAFQNSQQFLAAGKAYVTIPGANKRECFPVLSTECRRWLAMLSMRKLQTVSNAKAVADAVHTIDAITHETGRGGSVHRRLARFDDVLYLDLANSKGQVIKVLSSGWEVITDCPGVCFLRGPNMAEQVVPEQGSVNDFFNLINLAEADRPLLLGFLLDCLKGHGPYSVLLINGQQGSAKSTVTKMIRSLVDPASKAAVRRLQRDEYELALAAEQNALLCFDNVSSLPQWLSDAIASLSTGGGFAVRKLYGQEEEMVYGCARPVCFNGIPDFAESPDLLDRSIKITLPSIPDGQRRAEEEVWQQFEKLRPAVLGGLLNMVSKGLGGFAGHLPPLPRIASTAKWAMSCGCTDFIRLYADCRESLSELAVENSSLAQAILQIHLPFNGTATQLLEAVSNITVVSGVLVYDKAFPKNGTQLSTQLNRLTPDLGKQGVCVERGMGRQRKNITIKRV